MGPRDSRGSADTNGNGNGHGHSAGKAKAARTISRVSSNDSLRDLTPEVVDKGIAAMREMCRMLSFAQAYHNEIDVVESIHGLNMNQKDRIEELETIVDHLIFRKDREMERLQYENKEYQTNTYQLKREREELEREQAAINETRQAMQLDMERQKEKGINEASQEFSDKYKTKIRQIREEFEKKIRVVDMERDGLKNSLKELEEKKTKAQKDMNQQKKDFEIEKRSFQSHIIRLESELHYINAASIVAPQTPKFYSDSFHRLWELIRDVAVKGFESLPEDTKSLDSDDVRNQLFAASTIFKYHPLSSESAVSTFLRGCAIRDFLSRKTISIIRRQYFAEPTATVEHRSGTQTMDSILDIISNVPAANSSQELSWRLTTVDKLDRLGSRGPSTATISTEPDQTNIVKEIWDQLHHLQRPSNQQLDAKLSEITHISIILWRTLRKDHCQVNFDYNPSIGDLQGWGFLDDVVTNADVAATLPSGIPSDQLPSKPLVLFPQITGSFKSDSASRRILHAGLALSHDSLAFREGVQEIKHIENATKEFERKLRKGSSVQSSPVVGKHPGDWPAPPRDIN